MRNPLVVGFLVLSFGHYMLKGFSGLQQGILDSNGCKDETLHYLTGLSNFSSPQLVVLATFGLRKWRQHGEQCATTPNLLMKINRYPASSLYNGGLEADIDSLRLFHVVGNGLGVRN
jgi:hypothetical protein